MIVIVVHVICDDVTNVMKNVIEVDLKIDSKLDVSWFDVIDDVIEIDVTNVWFNIIVKNDIVKDFFDDGDEIDILWFWIIEKIDAKNETRFDVKFDIKISNLIFLIFLT